jgi:hypothetical protein
MVSEISKVRPLTHLPHFLSPLAGVDMNLKSQSFSLLKTLVLTVSLTNIAKGVHGATYHLRDNIVGAGFFNAFEWQAIEDPTHGRV